MSPEQNSAPAKLGAAMHVVCRTMANQPDKLGAVKLHKALWFADGTPPVDRPTITGGTFIRHQYGPCLKELDDAVAELERAGRVPFEWRIVAGLRSRSIARGEPDVNLLNERERKWLEKFAVAVCEDHGGVD